MLLAWTLGCSPAPPAVPALAEGVPRNLVLIVLDTVRGDALAQAHTPHMDALAAQGQQVDMAWAPGTWTGPSTVSLFTGRSVRHTGWDFVRPQPGQQRLGYPGVPPGPVLAEVLQSAGFATLGLSSNQLLLRELGFDRGFERWALTTDAALPARAAETFADWAPEGRNFAYLHLLATHSPLFPSQEACARWDINWPQGDRGLRLRRDHVRMDQPESVDRYRRAYHAVLEDTDARVGEIVAALGARAADTAIILTSDHGEMLGERARIGHGGPPFAGVSHVPLIGVGLPPMPDPVSTAAIPALATEALGLPQVWPTPAQAEPVHSQWAGIEALTLDGRSQGMWAPGATSADHQVFSVRSDPGALHASAPDPRLTEAHGALHARVPAGQLDLDAGGASAVLTEALQALGYLD